MSLATPWHICYKWHMAINLRNTSKELEQALKVRAASEGVFLQSLCVRFLWWGLEEMERRDGRVAQKVEVAPSLVPGEAGNGEVEQRGVIVTKVGGSNPSPSTTILTGSRGGGKTSSAEIDKVRNHDPKTCRVHKCGMCAVAKEKA